MSFIQWLLGLFSKKKDSFPAPPAQTSPAVPVRSAPIPVITPTPVVPVQPPANSHPDEPGPILGIDVSHYQDTVDGADARAKGYRFLIAKATDGTTDRVDYMLAKHKAVARQFDFIFTCYHFFRYDHDPLAQARQLLAAAGPIEKGDLPLCLDVEWDNASKDLGYHDSDHGGTRGTLDDAGADKAYACLVEIEKQSGMTPMLYTNPYFFTGFRNPERFQRFLPWLSAYTTTESKVHLCKPWPRLVFWQNTEHLRMKGSNGKIIEDVDGNKFEGSLNALRALCKQ